MPRSPETARAAPDSLRSYEDSWEAIYNLIDQGSSWSGGERNCAFLNTRTSAFANISAVSGIDFPDDARALAQADWDLDGRIDLWVTNRTAPRLRFLHNTSRGSGRFVLLRLQGMTSNRDAIGARVEVAATDGTRQIRTLRAGDGYLAQSSKWLHFGLGSAEGLREVVVRWPGGEAETFEGVAADARWHLVQGSGQARPWNDPRSNLRLEPGPVELPALPDNTRTWISGRVPFPAEHYESWEGAKAALADFRGRPVLVNLWSRSCGPCLGELGEWKSHHETLDQVGLAILALCVDEDADPRAAAARFAAALPFASGLATPEIVGAFEASSRAFLESRRPLPVPCSLLLDARGHIAALYQGTVSPDLLVADVGLLDLSAERQRAASLPFPGRWMTPPLAPNPRQVIGTFIKAGQTAEAKAYTLRCLDPDSGLALPPATRASLTLFLGDLELDAGELDRAVARYAHLFELAADDPATHREAGIRLVTKQRVPDAIRHLEKAVELDPAHADSRLNLANLLQTEGRMDRATGHLRELARQLPASAPVHFYLANALQAQGLGGEAIDHYRHAHRLNPGSPATNNLAWLLATHRDAALRNGAEAVTLAEAACQRTESRDPILLHTLAAAYAEAGDFAKAGSTAESALQLATATGNTQLSAVLARSLEAFRARQPLRE